MQQVFLIILLICCCFRLLHSEVQPHIPLSTSKQQQVPPYDQYIALCTFSNLYNIPCVVSGFSNEKNHSLDLTVSASLVYSTREKSDSKNILDVYDDFCTMKNNLISSSSTGSLAVAARGKCSFVKKVRVAQNLGYKALLLVNSDDDLFVVGGGDDTHDIHIPLFLVTRSFSAYLKVDKMNYRNEHDLIDVHLQFSKAKYMKYEFQAIGSVHMMGIMLLTALLIYPIGTFSFSPSTTIDTNTNIVQRRHYVICFLVVLISFTLRLGTMRISSPFIAGHNKFNHNETDERIYHTLVDAVLKNVYDYRLDIDTVRKFQLSEENYSDSIFIHPPMFTYMSAFLHSTIDVPLALISIIYHLITCVCIVFLIVFSDINCTRDNDMNRGRVAVTAVQLFCFCPVAFFCSQKVKQMPTLLYIHVI